jgi:leucyl-tRNA synthetase
MAKKSVKDDGIKRIESGKSEKEIDFAKIEKKWQARWEKAKIFEVKEDKKKKKYYVLEMFPYPSGTGIHMGHAFNYTIGDIFARFKIMQGFNVLHPMGFDSLGLPAENAAIKVGTHPEDYTNQSIPNFVKQQKALGITYDWSRVVNTADPEYYRWDQWIFLKMFEQGLVYQKESPVNWCSKCNTILANEQVVNGNCWRHEDTEVEIKNMNQWYLKITDYADRLLKGYDKLNWPEKTIAMQKNWIGKSFGTEIDFEVNGEKWPIFTTRPDTIYGVTFVVVSAQHSRLNELVTKEQKKEVEKFLKKLKSVSEKELAEMEKEGVFTGSYAINPATNEKVPVYAGNFVVADYGSGMVMAVPAHDQRDFDFAKKYSLKIKRVIESKPYERGEKLDIDLEKAYTGSGFLINSEIFDGFKSEEAKVRITEHLEDEGLARKKVNYKLRDWSVARQRYWGTPIPLIHCSKCGVVPVSEKDLPVKLPKEVKFGKGNPLETNEKWLNVKCPKCSGKARREPNTLDTFVNSSWYFLRYCDPQNKKEIFSKEKARYWMPIDLYIGGAEHTCMHLIYCRFYTVFLHDLGLIDFDEPAPRLFHQGMINGSGGEKMSKSKGNGIEPLEAIKKYGTDALRYYLVSVASPDKGFNWDDKGIQGSLRFVKKAISILDNIKIGKDSEEVKQKLGRTIKAVSEQIEKLDYRKTTIELRELFDLISAQNEVSKASLESAFKLLTPFCPHIAEEMWEKVGGKGFVSVAEWPKVDESKIDVKFAEAEMNVEKTVNDISNVLRIIKEKQGKDGEKIYLYVMPFELVNYNSEILSKRMQKEVKVFAVNDKSKYDPEGKASKAKPGKPGIFVE